jgi:hypothetical protein
MTYIIQKALSMQTEKVLTIAVEGATKLMIQKHLADPEVGISLFEFRIQSNFVLC